MNEVYLGIFERSESGLPVSVGEERLLGPQEIDELPADSAAARHAAGFGWQRYPGLSQLNAARFAASSLVLHPHARFLLGIAEPDAAIAAEDVSPAYLRQKVAEKPAPAGS